MFLAKAGKLRGLGRFGDYQDRSPIYKIDNWIGAGAAGGGAVAPTPQIVPGVSNTTTAAIGIGGLAAAAALAYYLMK